MTREVKYADPDKLLIVGLDVDESGNPLYDERFELPVDINMVRNIMVYGVQQPALVREEAGQLFVIDGRQRVKAAREAAKMQSDAGEHSTKVPYMVVKADDNRVAGIMVSANEIRQDDEVLIKAKKAVRLLDMLGAIDEVAISFGKSTKTIQNWLMLAQADPAVHEAINNGRISSAAGITIARGTRDEQLADLQKLLSQFERVSESTAKKAKSQSKHPGIKKAWVRQAMKTDAFKKLAEEEQATLDWILTGTAPKGSWMDEFTFGADVELHKAAQQKALKAEQERKAAEAAAAAASDPAPAEDQAGDGA